jgi:hypothetical protein
LLPLLIVVTYQGKAKTKSTTTTTTTTTMEDDDPSSSTTNDDTTTTTAADVQVVGAFCCSKCRGYLHMSEEAEEDNSNNDDDSCCWLCLGLWQEDVTKLSSSLTTSSSSSRLRKALEDACRPYGGIDKKINKFCKKPNHIPTVSLSGDLHLRYRYLEQSSSPRRPLLFSTYLQDLKQHLHTQIKYIIYDNGNGNDNGNDDQQDDKDHRKVLEEEEQGSLSIHLLCLPPKNHPMNIALQKELLNNNTVNSINKKRKRCNKRQQSKPFITQGGDPRANLETRLRSSNSNYDGCGYGYEWISQSTAEELVSSSGMILIPTKTNNSDKKNDDNDDDNDNSGKSSTTTSTMMSSIFEENYFCNNDNNMTATTTASKPITTMMRMEYHVAVFRRPIFLYGYYTKSRRDVSQTPFVVMREKTSMEKTKDIADDISSNKKQAETLGVTSVEEQICYPIQDMLGVSTLNNIISSRSNTSGSGGGGGVLYGMIKFHASGREDMDVRMLVRRNRPSDLDSDSAEEKTTTSCHGRPFCVQIVDALRPIISSKQLRNLIDTINHTTPTTTITDTTEIFNSQTSNNNYCNSNAISYGQNPMGVGISPDTFKPVPAAIFSGLQKDTESKTKHYGCYCWSKNILPHNDNENDNNITSFIFHNIDFPLTIQQRTPVRVLHRRCNMIRERKVICANAIRIDDHHFRLEISTQAGTYVKEFVYGDFGRTVPSVSSIMGCKTNLLKLDCEGIEIPLSPSSMDINGGGSSSSTTT